MNTIRVTLIAAFTMCLSLAPAIARAQATSAPPSDPASTSVCSNYAAVMAGFEFPAEALAQNIKHGTVLVEFILASGGQVTNVRAIESTHPVFATAAVELVSKLQCRGQGKDTPVRVPFVFRIED